MTPPVDSLAALLSGFECAMVTLVDVEGHPRTRPMRPVRAPFNGHLWFHLSEDAESAQHIGRGTEVSVAYGGSAAGPYVTVNGWAIVLRNPSQVKAVWRPASAASTLQPALAGALICVCARAAEVWDVASSASRRVITFAHANTARIEHDTTWTQERAFRPRLVAMSTMSCAS